MELLQIIAKMTTEAYTHCKTFLDESSAYNHGFLARMRSGIITETQLRRLVIQWSKMAKCHRELFPGLIFNIKDDQIRFELVNILHEEYGSGVQSDIHGTILGTLETSLGISSSEIAATTTAKATIEFEEVTRTIWVNGSTPLAYALHFGLEYLAQAQQYSFSIGLRKSGLLNDYQLRYFDIHADAEKRHVLQSQGVFIELSRNANNSNELVEGIEIAEKLLSNAWSEFELIVFANNCGDSGDINIQNYEHSS